MRTANQLPVRTASWLRSANPLRTVANCCEHVWATPNDDALFAAGSFFGLRSQFELAIGSPFAVSLQSAVSPGPSISPRSGLVVSRSPSVLNQKAVVSPLPNGEAERYAPALSHTSIF